MLVHHSSGHLLLLWSLCLTPCAECQSQFLAGRVEVRSDSHADVFWQIRCQKRLVDQNLEPWERQGVLFRVSNREATTWVQSLLGQPATWCQSDHCGRTQMWGQGSGAAGVFRGSRRMIWPRRALCSRPVCTVGLGIQAERVCSGNTLANGPQPHALLRPSVENGRLVSLAWVRLTW